MNGFSILTRGVGVGNDPGSGLNYRPSALHPDGANSDG